jgi:formylglycine-generating enzyme required for sulfatase activity
MHDESGRTTLLCLALVAALALPQGGCGSEQTEGRELGDCSDGADNDADGLYDCLDEGCDGSPDCSGDDDDVSSDCLSLTTSQGIDQVYVCGGSFEMGCTAGQVDCFDNERPAHSVTLTHDFWLGMTEVTQGQWSGLMANNPSWFSPDGEGAACGLDCPVETVNFWEALAFANVISAAEGLGECYILSGCSDDSPGLDMECTGVAVNSPAASVYDCEGYRLPTEAEWEYAARADTDLLYSGSDSIDEVGWCEHNSAATTHPVAQKQANAFGFYDLSGNVWEWTWDWWDESYYVTSPETDPDGAGTGQVRVHRGGAWGHAYPGARVAYRNNGILRNGTNLVGLRLARSVP